MTERPLESLLGEVRGWMSQRRDSWSSVPMPVPPRMFGSASRRPFSWYFEGHSQVSVDGVADVEMWLHGCHYVSERGALGRDSWQHPAEFETIRIGDCGDHAVWGWRKLVELGMPTSLFVGRWLVEEHDAHVWLVTSVSGEPHLFEATSKILGEALKPLEDVRDTYRPFLSVDQDLKTRAYIGGAEDLLRSPFD